MPPVIAAGLTAAGVSGTVAGISIASLIGEGVTLGGIFAVGILTRPRGGGKKTAGEMVTTRQPVPPRVRAYGRVKIGGAIYFQTAPWWLMKGIYLCEGEIDAVEEIWLGDYKTIYSQGQDFNVAGVWPWFDMINFVVQRGTIPQSTNASIAINNSWWDGSHAGNGLANIVMMCNIPWNPKDNFSKRYPNGVPPLRAVLRGERIFDPRDGTQSASNKATWKYSDNPALCILDFLTSSRGFNIPNSRINIASFTAFANLCDTTVLRHDGQTEKSYVCWGTYELTEEPRAVLQRLLLACDGEIVQLGDGTIALRGGQFVTPTVTITSSMILGYEIQSGPDKVSTFNQYTMHYTGYDYQLVQGPNYDDIPAQAANGGQIISQNLDLAMVPSVWQAMRLAKIYMAENNPRQQLVIRASIAALDALSERIINLTIDELGINDTFLIKKFDISGDLQSCTISLSSLPAEAYNVAPVVNDIAFSFLGDPTNLAVPIPSDPMITHTAAPQLQLSVLAPSDLTLELRAQTSADGGNTWTYMTANGSFSAVSVGLASNSNDWGLVSESVTETRDYDVVLDIVSGFIGYGFVSDAVIGGGVYQVRAAFRRITGANTGPDGFFTLAVDVLLDAVAYGMITTSIAARTAQDYGLASVGVTSSDDWALASASANASLDLGFGSG